MPASTEVFIADNGSAASYRVWGMMMSSKLLASGFVQTADTGQVDWNASPPNAVPGTGVRTNYEIWRFDDALQSTAPVFFRIDYGTATGFGEIAMWITFGTASNGAGTITGVPLTILGGASDSLVVGTWYFSGGDGNRWCVVRQAATAGNTGFLMFERTVDDAGNPTSEGVLCITRWGNPPAYAQVAWNRVTGSYGAETVTLGAMSPTLAPFGLYGTQISVYPIFHNKGVFLNPGLNALCYFNALLVAGVPVQFEHYGVMHWYMPLGAPGYSSCMRPVINTQSIMTRYE